MAGYILLMERKTLMAALRVAGYHEDQKAFTRLYCGNRVSKKKAQEQYSVGQAQKLGGVNCGCFECENRSKDATN